MEVSVRMVVMPMPTLPGTDIRKASLFFGGRSEKRLGRSSPPQNSSIGGRMHSEEEGEETLLTSL